MFLTRGIVRPKRPALWLVMFALLEVSCSRPGGQPADGAQADQHQVPFQNAANAQGESTPEVSPAGSSKGRKAETDLPFRDAQGLPAGTLVTVRLKEDISSDDPGKTRTFGAIVDEPVLVEGNMLLPRGAKVAGRVESSRTSQVKRNRGYIRLTLDAIDLDGRELPVQTSSLFVHGKATHSLDPDDESSPQVIHLESGKRLTFRLTEPVSMAGVAMTGH